MDQRRRNGLASTMKGYVINLDRSVDRLRVFQARASSAGLDFERFPAIDGASLEREIVAHWGQLCKTWGPLTSAEVATFLSHRGVWLKIAAGDDPWAFVVEDDVLFASDIASILSSDEWLPKDIGLVKVETMLTRVELSARVLGSRGGYKIRVLKENHNGAAGYLVSREGARFLYEWSRTRCEPVDRLMFHPSQLAGEGKPIAQMTPALCIQDFHLLSRREQEGAISTIGPILNRRGGAGRDRRWPARLLRLVVRTTRDIRRFGLWASRQSIFERVEMSSFKFPR